MKTNAGQYEYPKYNSAVSGSYKLTDDFVDNFGLVPRTVRDINFTPNDSRLPDLGICRIFSNRRDAEIIITALRSAAAAAALGSIKSAKKSASSRENGKKGGRPAGKKVLIRNQFHNTEKVFSIKSSYFGNDPDFDALTALEYQIYSGGDDIEYAKKKQAEIKKALCGQSDCRCGCKIVKIL